MERINLRSVLTARSCTLLHRKKTIGEAINLNVKLITQDFIMTLWDMLERSKTKEISLKPFMDKNISVEKWKDYPNGEIIKRTLDSVQKESIIIFNENNLYVKESDYKDFALDTFRLNIEYISTGVLERLRDRRHNEIYTIEITEGKKYNTNSPAVVNGEITEWVLRERERKIVQQEYEDNEKGPFGNIW